MRTLCFIGTFFFLLLDTDAQNTGQGISLAEAPQSGKVPPGQDVVFSCTIDLNILSDNFLVVWIRRFGTLQTKIAVGTIKQDEFLNINRYKLSMRSEKGNKRIYTLTITDVQYEDSGIVECGILHSSRKDSQVLAVCDDPKSDSCNCVYETGWPSPQCFGESKSVKDIKTSYDRTVTGLGVCFAIAVIYGIIVTVFFARDCMKIIYKNNQLKLAKIKNQQRGYNPYVNSEKITVEDDLGSIPESGVWSQSDGRNGSDHSSGRPCPPQGIPSASQMQPSEARHEHPSKEPGISSVQTHVNPAYDSEEVDRYPEVIPTEPSGGVRPKIPHQSPGKYPAATGPSSQYPVNREPYRYPELQQQRMKANPDSVSPGAHSYPDPAPYTSPKPGATFEPYGAVQDASAPSRVPPERPPPPQQQQPQFTDVTIEQPSAGSQNFYERPHKSPHSYASPQKHMYTDTNSMPTASPASFIDQHDTVI